MKKLTKIVCFNIALFLIVGCVGTTSGEPATEPSDYKGETTETDEHTSVNELEESDIDDVNDASSEETVDTDSDRTSSVNDLNAGDQEDKDSLAQYASDQIEYARVWLQLGPNQEIDVLDVRHIPAGTPLNPDDDIDVSYPEDVIQLRGSRLVDGIVTYSGNGDGTINVYNVPLRWYGGFPPPEDVDEEAIREQMEDIIKNTKSVYVDPGNDEEVIALIEVLNIVEAN